MSRKRVSEVDRNVFINCPFDDEFKPIFESLVFAVHDCGFVARCALEIEDSSQVRIDKIFNLIERCPFGIHDISREENLVSDHIFSPGQIKGDRTNKGGQAT